MSLRPAIPRDCRVAFRSLDDEAAAAHEATCAFCAARTAARRTLVEPLSARPAAPAELAQPSFLQSIYERTVERSEHGPVAEWLNVAPLPEGTGDAEWGQRLQTSGVAEELGRRPAAPEAAAWSRVHQEIVSGAAATTARTATGRWPTLLAGAAVAAIVAAISVSNGTQPEPRIVFTELSDAPDVPFAVVRYGAKD